MIRFKQYLLESEEGSNFTKFPKFTKLTKLDDYVDVIKKHCMQSFQHTQTGHALFRGVNVNGATAYGIGGVIDTTESRRVSKDTKGVYQWAFAVYDKMNHIPSRDTSLICTPSSVSAESYGEYGDVYYVLPFDGTPIATASTKDVAMGEIATTSKYAALIKSAKAAGPAMLPLHDFDHLVRYASVITNSDNFSSLAELDNALSKLSAGDAMTLINSWTYNDAFDILSDEEAIDLHSFVTAATTGAMPTEDVLNSKVFNKARRELKKTANGKLIASLWDSLPVEKRATTICLDILDHSNFKIKVGPITDPRYYDSECWFTGKALLIQGDDMMRQIYKEMSK